MSGPKPDQIGYTDDGRVFMLINTQYNGQPVQTIVQWNTENAARVGNAILEAVKHADAKTKAIADNCHERNRTDID